MNFPVFVSGFYTGLLLSLIIGPVFFALIKQSINYGFRQGMVMALGIVLSDASYIALCYLLSVELLKNETVSFVLGLAGCILIAVTGLFYVLKPEPKPKVEGVKKKYGSSFIKGFLLNLINVNVFFFWLVAVNTVSALPHYSKTDIALFFSATLLAVFLTDLIKAALAKSLQKRATPKALKNLNIIIGIIMMVFGVAIFIKLFFFGGLDFSGAKLEL